MKKITLGTNALEVSRLGLGCMGMSAFYTGSGKDDAGSTATIRSLRPSPAIICAPAGRPFTG